ncbi:hypothetical protein SDC9_206997 [bioreactor metagenome]|uniref:Uncharacterized protein n=1 Tax=bioreactor metagenome TaxID=1076179 RepID=A0A645J766_9ZZZZ
MFKDDQRADTPVRERKNGRVHVPHEVAVLHGRRVKPLLAKALAAAAQLFEYAAQLRLKQNDQNDDDGAGREHGIQQPAQRGQ